MVVPILTSKYRHVPQLVFQTILHSVCPIRLLRSTLIRQTLSSFRGTISTKGSRGGMGGREGGVVPHPNMNT